MERTATTSASIAHSTDNARSGGASIGAAPKVGARLQSGMSLTGLCLGTGEILLCNDTTTDRRGNPKLCEEMGIRSVLILPIKQHAKVVGVLEVLSINPNAFNQHDATAMSKLADRVLPLLSESATMTDRCLDQLPSQDIGAVRDPQNLLAHADLLKEQNNRLRTTDTAEAPEWNGHYIGSTSPDQPARMTIHDRPR